VEQVAERVEHDRHRAHVREAVTGADHEVRLQCRQSTHPGLLAALARRHVQVGQVQHLQRRVTVR
jgi:hypothetical protein